MFASLAENFFRLTDFSDGVTYGTSVKWCAFVVSVGSQILFDVDYTLVRP